MTSRQAKNAVAPAVDPVMLIKDAAEYAKCHVETIRGAARRHEIAVIRAPGRSSHIKVRQSAVDMWIASQEQPVSRHAVPGGFGAGASGAAALRAEVERLKADLAALKPAPPTCGKCGARVCLTCGRKGLHPVPCPECGMGWSACFPTCQCGTEMHQEASADGPRLFCPGCGCKP